MILDMPRVRGFWWRAYHRGFNRVHDGLARLAGACNRSTWDGTGYAGGYAHWRCAKARGHVGVHRFVNYVWAGPGARAEYDPLPVLSPAAYRDLVSVECPFQHVTRKRYMIDSLRRTRVRRRVAEAAR